MLGSLALIVALGGVGIAAIPDNDGVIHACYAKKGGDTRLVKSEKKCKKKEKTVSWNQEGERGATGSQGVQGQRGATGPIGVAGTNGANGIDGSPGQAGSSGPGLLFTAGSVANSATRYTSIANQTFQDPNGETGAQAAIPPGAQLTARDFAVRTQSAVAGGDLQVAFRVNGANALSCTIPNGAQSCQSTQTFALNPGDLVNYRVIASGAANVNNASYAVRIVF